MIQLGQRQWLFPEQLAGSFVGNGAGRQDLERYVMAEGLANHL